MIGVIQGHTRSLDYNSYRESSRKLGSLQEKTFGIGGDDADYHCIVRIRRRLSVPPKGL